MRCLNEVRLFGRVGTDPELKEFDNGNCVCTLSLATNSGYKDKSGEWVEQTEWHNLIFWNQQAEFVSKYVLKGNRILCSGSLKTEKWENNEGEARSKVVINVREVITMDYNDDSESNSGIESKPKSKGKGNKKPAKAKAQESDDLPW